MVFTRSRIVCPKRVKVSLEHLRWPRTRGRTAKGHGSQLGESPPANIPSWDQLSLRKASWKERSLCAV